MDKLDKSLVLGVASLSLYILGGVSTFGGLGMIVLFKEKDLYGLGDGSTLGYLFVCVGLCVSILGVMLMRILRNRRLA